MKKSKKVISKKVGKILLIVLFLYILGTIMFVSVFPRIYLSHKYNTSLSDYKVYDYFPGYFAYDINYWNVVWHESQLVYEAKDDSRIFKVKFMNFQYYDAYQMKEVSKWITEELQDNIDKNIDIVNVGDGSVYGIYDKDKGKYKNVVWTKDNVKYIIEGNMISNIFIKTDDIAYYLKKSENHYRNYYNIENTNASFDAYINELCDKFYSTYQINNLCLYLHENDLELFEGYYLYGVNINTIPDDAESDIIKYDERE